jgi:radical SAM superfamily enzyme YgiQ (UPF0313 family)
MRNPRLRKEEPIETLMFKHVLCVYPYRYDLKNVSFFPPLGLEFIAAAITPYARDIDIVDLRKEAGRTRDFVRPDTELICFSVNWDTEPDFIRDEILSVGSDALIIVGGRHATNDPEVWLSQCPNVGMVIRGDGEEAVQDVCNGLPLGEITGLSYRKNGTENSDPSARTSIPTETDDDTSMKSHSRDSGPDSQSIRSPAPGVAPSTATSAPSAEILLEENDPGPHARRNPLSMSSNK